MSENKKDEILGKQLNDDELDQVAGGTTYGYGSSCESTYKENEWCWSSDYCRNAINFYAMNEECETTYNKIDSCVQSDSCGFIVNKYHF